MKSGKNYAFAGTPAKEVGLALNGEINNLTFFGEAGGGGAGYERRAFASAEIEPFIA